MRVLPVVFVVVGSLVGSNAQAQNGFPFERELLLDVAPMRGSKRVPILEVSSDGRASIDLWCQSLKAQAMIEGQSFTLSFGPLRDAQCPPERLRADEEMLVALAEVTQWRLDGHLVVLNGKGKSLHFRPAGN